MAAARDLAAAYDRVLVFDGACVLCSGTVRFILKRERDRVIRFVTAQSAQGQAMLEALGLPRDEWESVVFVDGGKPRVKSAAVFAVLRHLRFPWPLLRAARIVPRPFRDWLYDRVARNRYDWFGRRDDCFVPAPGQRHRFLDAPGAPEAPAGPGTGTG